MSLVSVKSLRGARRVASHQRRHRDRAGLRRRRQQRVGDGHRRCADATRCRRALDLVHGQHLRRRRQRVGHGHGRRQRAAQGRRHRDHRELRAVVTSGAQVKSLLQLVAADLRRTSPSSDRARTPRGDQPGCDNPEGTVTIDQETGEISLGNCDLDGFNYNGFFAVSDEPRSISASPSPISSTGESESLDGSLTQEVVGDDVREHGLLRSHVDVSATFSVDFERARSRSAHRQLRRRRARVQRRRRHHPRGRRHPAELRHRQTSPWSRSTWSTATSLPFNFNLVTEELTPVPN